MLARESLDPDMTVSELLKLSRLMKLRLVNSTLSEPKDRAAVGDMRPPCARVGRGHLRLSTISTSVRASSAAAATQRALDKLRASRSLDRAQRSA